MRDCDFSQLNRLFSKLNSVLYSLTINCWVETVGETASAPFSLAFICVHDQLFNFCCRSNRNYESNLLVKIWNALGSLNMAINGSDAGNDQINLVATSTDFNSYFGCLTCGCRTIECVQCHAIKIKTKTVHWIK